MNTQIVLFRGKTVMVYGRIKNIFIGGDNTIGTIEYDDGRKLIFYEAQTDIDCVPDLSVGEYVLFEIKETNSGNIKAKNVQKV